MFQISIEQIKRQREDCRICFDYYRLKIKSIEDELLINFSVLLHEKSQRNAQKLHLARVQYKETEYQLINELKTAIEKSENQIIELTVNSQQHQAKSLLKQLNKWQTMLTKDHGTGEDKDKKGNEEKQLLMVKSGISSELTTLQNLTTYQNL